MSYIAASFRAFATAGEQYYSGLGRCSHPHPSDELRIRGPEPGGFESAFDRDSANAMFLYLATTKKVTRTLPKPDAATNT